MVELRDCQQQETEGKLQFHSQLTLMERMFASLKVCTQGTYCIWCKIRVQLHSFACGYLVFPTQFVAKTKFLSLKKILKYFIYIYLFIIFKNIYLFIWLCWVLVVAYGIQFPDQGSNPGPQHWERGLLTTGPPGKSLFIYFWLYHVACRMLVPQPGIEPRLSAVRVQSPNHWTQGIPFFFFFLM